MAEERQISVAVWVFFNRLNKIKNSKQIVSVIHTTRMKQLSIFHTSISRIVANIQLEKIGLRYGSPLEKTTAITMYWKDDVNRIVVTS